MKKSIKKSLLLSTQKVRDLRPLQTDELRAAVGGRPACPDSQPRVVPSDECP